MDFDTPDPESVNLEGDDSVSSELDDEFAALEEKHAKAGPQGEAEENTDLSLVEDDSSDDDISDNHKPDEESPEPVAALPAASKKEDFSDVKQFAENLVIGKIQTNANPPYSILLTGLEDGEDAEDIIGILNEYGLTEEGQESLYRKALNCGTLLISQISEYSAVLLSHRLRRFNAQIKVGHSSLLHPPKNYEGDSFKIQTSSSLFQDREEKEDFSNTSQNQDILHTNLDFVEGYQVLRYLGIVHVEKVIELEKSSSKDIEIDIYKGDLVSDLDKKARNKGANALLGIRFQSHTSAQNSTSSNTLIIQATATAVFLRKRKNVDAGSNQSV